VEGLRVNVRVREATYPTLEEFMVAALATVVDKSKPSFDANWANSAGRTLWDG
jgi:hypothetical protein